MPSLLLDAAIRTRSTNSCAGLPDDSGWQPVGEARQSHPAMHIGVVTRCEPTVHGVGADAADFITREPLRAVERLARLASLGALPDSGPT